MNPDIPQLLDQLIQLFRPMSQTLTQASHRQEDTVALAQLPQLAPELYLPWTSSAIRPSSLLLVLNEVCIHQRKQVLECGSGISTLYLSKVLAQTGGSLISIDHDSQWQDVVQKQAIALGIPLNNTTLISAPLSPCPLSPKGLAWYDLEVLMHALPDCTIDLLLVDAPIAGHPDIAESRYPALPFFAERLESDFAIFLDDCHRKGEQHIAKSWTDTYQLAGRYLPERGNICLMHPPAAKRFNIL